MSAIQSCVVVVCDDCGHRLATACDQDLERAVALTAAREVRNGCH